MHRPGNRILPGLRPAARPYGVTAPAPLAPILDGPTAGWHLAFAERLRGPLDVAALRTAWDTVTAHQDALRYRVSDCAGIVEPAGAVPLPIEDVDAGDLTDRLAALAGAGFDPADRLWRLGLYRLAPDDHVLAFAGHRAVFDVRAQALLYADLARAYRDARAGRPPELAPLRVVFADYVAWRGWQVNRRGQADLAWWTAHLDGVASRLELPADVPADAAPRTARPLRTGHSTVDAPLAAGVGALARSLGATPAAVVLAALGTVLARLTGQADFVVGTPLAGRRPPAAPRRRLRHRPLPPGPHRGLPRHPVPRTRPGGDLTRPGTGRVRVAAGRPAGTAAGRDGTRRPGPARRNRRAGRDRRPLGR